MHPGCRIDQVFLCREPVDFRKSIGGLSVLVEQALGRDPFGSALYVFVNRSRNKIKVLYWHRNGFCLWLKQRVLHLVFENAVHSSLPSWPSAPRTLTRCRCAPASA